MPDALAPPRARLSLVLVSLLLGACQGPGGKEEGGGEPFAPSRAPPEDSIGYFLVQYDKGLARWSEIKLGPRGPREDSRLRALEESLRELAVERRDELLSELVTGSPKNREVAVVALGFTGDPVVLGPLLQALSDPAPAVVQKTHLALGILGLAETPLAPITEDLLGNPEPWTRNNAAFAVHRIVAAGGRVEGLDRILVSALSDPEPGVRAQAASTLGILAEPGAIEPAAALLADPVTLVSRAAAATLGAIARAHPESAGACARGLAGALATAPESARPGLIEELALMRGGSLGDDPLAWRDWASRLP
jgi:HEAT repeat protein